MWNTTRDEFVELVKTNRPRAVARLVDSRVFEWLQDGGPEEVKRALRNWFEDGLDLGNDDTIIGLAEGRLFE
jgi:hypothetical protein